MYKNLPFFKLEIFYYLRSKKEHGFYRPSNLMEKMT